MLLNNKKNSLFYSILKNIKEENINILITIHQYVIINILPLDEGVTVDEHTRKKNFTRDEVEGDNFFTVC